MCVIDDIEIEVFWDIARKRERDTILSLKDLYGWMKIKKQIQ